jgi:hypothetical protein
MELVTATTGHWNIKMVTQPDQSPGTKQLDLTFSRALKSTQQWDSDFALEIDGLIAQVTRTPK